MWGDSSPTISELILRRKDGRELTVLDNAHVVRDPEGSILYYEGTLTDITDRKRMDQELRSSKERLDFVVTSNPAVILTGKPHLDYADFDTTYMSSNVVSMLGYEAKEFIDDPKFWKKHTYPEDARRVLSDLPRLFKDGHVSSEYRFLHKDGAYRWICEEAIMIRDSAGVPIEVIGYWTNITERKQMEEALLKSERLVAIGQVAPMVGHDLRNPLEAIAGATYLLKTQATRSMDDKSRESLQIIEKSIEYSDKIINGLLEYSAEIKLQQSTTDPRSITGDALSLVRIPENIPVVNRTQTDPKILVDANKVRRAFLNIIGNAVDAMPQGGTLMISSRQTDGDVELVFTDTGVGMTKETLGKLWTPLFTTKAKGMGFGLAVSKRIVEVHGGTISADSTFGKGSTFTVKLPIKRRPEEVRES